MITSLKRWSLYLTGDFSDFTMQQRAFNLISGLITLLFSYAAIVYLALGYHDVALWVTIMIGMNSYLFYLSRFQRKFKIASFSFAILSYPLLGINYFINSGISGPTVYLFFMTLIVNIVITPKKYQLLWGLLHIVLVPILFWVENAYPSSTLVHQLTPSDRILELTLTYVPCIIFLGSLAIFLATSYNFEHKVALIGKEKLQQKNEELEFSSKEKDRLFGIIAHDLRGPLGSIKAYLEMLDFDQLSPEDRAFLNKQLLGLTHNTTNLLNNLLNWSVHSVWQNTDLTSVTLKPHLTEVIDLLRPEAERKGIELVLEMEDEDLSLMAESEMLHLVIRNLVNNAIKFSNQDSKVTIAASFNEGKANIIVKDTGLGIPETQQQAIFGTQVKPAIGTQSEKGVGLGLVLCHDFVKAMKGSINFYSKENEGTEFIITLDEAS